MTTPPSPLRVAVIGCGRMGLATLPRVREHLPACWLPLSHAEATLSHPALQLVGLCDPFDKARKQAAALHPSVSVYADAQRLLQEQSPDLVCIATRTPERAGLIEICLDAGVRHLHLEKPLCTSLAELKRLSLRFRQSQVHATFGALRRYLAPYRRAQQLLQAGAVGSLQEVQVALGAGLLCWTQIHAIDLMAAFLPPGSITEVRALAQAGSYVATGRELDGDPMLRLASFATSSGAQGLISTAGGCDLWLHGDQGILAVLNDGAQLTHRRASASASPYWLDHADLPVAADRHAGTAAALDRHFYADPAQAAADTEALLQAQRLLFACVQSMLADGSPVHPDELDPGLLITGRSGNLYA